MELRESSGRPFSDWLKKGLLSGKISGVVMGVTDLIFYLAFAVCYSWSFIRQTTLFTRIMTHDQRHFVDGIYNNMALVAILCGIVALLLQNSVRLAVFEGVLAAAGYACWKEGSGKAYLFVMCALIVGATGRSFRVILSETVFLGTVLMICAVSASQMGIIEDLVYNGTRHSFGIVYCTDCAAHILFLMLAWLMLRIESIRAADYLPLIPAMILMSFNGAKTNFLCALMMIAGTVLYHLTVRWKGRRIWKWPAAVLCCFFPLFTVFSLCAPFLINIDQPALRARLDSIDPSLTMRLEMGRRAFSEYEVRLFGTKMSEHGFGGKVGGFEGWDKYFFIDNSYVRLLMLGGVSLLLLLIAALTWSQLRCFVSGRYGCVFLLWIIAVVCVMEHHLIEPSYNIFPLMAFTGSSFFRIRNREGKKSARKAGHDRTENGTVEDANEKSPPRVFRTNALHLLTIACALTCSGMV